MRIAFFPNLTTTQARVVDYPSFEAFCASKLVDRHVAWTKKDGALFSFAQYSEAMAERRNINVLGMAGIALDFDNKEGSTTEPELLENELEGIEHAVYSTYSHNGGAPKFRLVIPFSKVISVHDWPRAFAHVLSLLGNPAGCDSSAELVSRAYFLPGCPAEHLDKAFSKYFPGKPLELDFSEFVPVVAPWNKQPKKISGRNDKLASIVSACADKGKSFEQTVQEAIEYDREHHQPPLFEDASERPFIAGNPQANAMRFVSNIWFSHAQNKGMVPVMRTSHIRVELSVGEEEKKEGKAISLEELLRLPPRLFDSVPGFVGEVASWITETAPRPQPAFSLGAALCAVGVLKGHRVQSDTGLRTNIYGLGIGASGAGKEHPGRMIQLLFQQADQGLLLCGEPTSDAGLLKHLATNHGRSLVQWDEFGHALLALASKNAAVHQRKIIDQLLKLFTKANSTYYGKEYANHDGKTARNDIEQPCLAIWGTTTPERFYQAMTGDSAVDGFLPRWLAFFGNPPQEGMARKVVTEDAPEELVRAVKELSYLPTNVRASGNIDNHNRIRPAIVPFSAAAERELRGYQAFFEKEAKEARKEVTGLDALWNRGLEHTVKVSLVVTSSLSIDLPVLEWSFELVKHCLRASARAFIENVTETSFQRQVQRILNILRKNGDISQETLYRKAKMPCRELRSILEFLEQSGQIKSDIIAPGKLGGPPTQKWAIY